MAEQIRGTVQRDIVPLLLALADGQGHGQTRRRRRRRRPRAAGARDRAAGTHAADAGVRSRDRADREGALRVAGAADGRRRRRGALRLPRRRRPAGRLHVQLRREGAPAVDRTRAHASSSTSRSMPRSSPNRAEPPDPVRVMISCGEPSGDLYAGALATEIFRARSRPPSSPASAASACAPPARSLVGDFSGLSVTGLLEVARVLPRTYAIYRRLVARRRRRRGPTSSSRSTFPTSTSGSRARCASSACRSSTTSARSSGRGGRGRHEDDAADRRSRAGHLSVRGGDLPGGGRAGRSGSAIRCST